MLCLRKSLHECVCGNFCRVREKKKQSGSYASDYFQLWPRQTQSAMCEWLPGPRKHSMASAVKVQITFKVLTRPVGELIAICKNRLQLANGEEPHRG